jgi:peptide/nickel transport system permease protein
VVRAVTLLIRDAEYVEAAQAVGVKSGRVIWRYVLPNLMSPVLVQTTLILAFALLAEAGLSFLGVGAPADTPSWGGIIADGRPFSSSAPWLTVFPGIAIALTVPRSTSWATRCGTCWTRGCGVCREALPRLAGRLR